VYAPEDKFVSDFWTVKKGEDYHLFFLQAPRALGDPDLRHFHHSIGHAVSRDLVNWTTLPPALMPDLNLPHERKGLATGSVTLCGDTYHMLYVGVGDGGHGTDHSICLATSRDLIHWDRHPGNPVLKKEGSYYDVSACWADPFIIAEPDGYYAFFKAHDRRQPKGYDGCVGAAVSRDFIHWDVLPPVFSPGLFGEPEVPAVYRRDGYYYLIAMTIPPVVTDLYRERIKPATPQWGDIYMVADHVLGPYRPETGIQLTQTADEMMMVRLLENPKGELVALSWWQGYEWYWKDWIKDHVVTQPPCRLNDPRPARFVPVPGGPARLVIG
jgi:beta-fructofuranosidase